MTRLNTEILSRESDRQRIERMTEEYLQRGGRITTEGQAIIRNTPARPGADALAATINRLRKSQLSWAAIAKELGRDEVSVKRLHDAAVKRGAV